MLATVIPAHTIWSNTAIPRWPWSRWSRPILRPAAWIVDYSATADGLHCFVTATATAALLLQVLDWGCRLGFFFLRLHASHARNRSSIDRLGRLLTTSSPNALWAMEFSPFLMDSHPPAMLAQIEARPLGCPEAKLSRKALVVPGAIHVR